MTFAKDQTLLRDRAASVMAMAVARSWKDADYRAELVANPKAVLAEEGFVCPDGVELEIVQDTPAAKYVSLPPDAADSVTAVSLVEQALPLQAGRELRLVQSTDSTWYLVLPMLPVGVQLDETPELVLNRAAGIENGWVWTTADVVVSVEVGVSVAAAAAAVVVVT
ncbi:hypothetical protein CTZ27_21055 [Streptomyces griseocarneus]|nr:hypothetical protein CTZ27_21055 [Streptomyces griseocarneus]